MKEKRDQILQSAIDVCLIDEAKYQLVPVESLQNSACKAGVVNLYYQDESANEANFDFGAIIDEAWNAVNQES